MLQTSRRNKGATLNRYGRLLFGLGLTKCVPPKKMPVYDICTQLQVIQSTKLIS